MSSILIQKSSEAHLYLREHAFQMKVYLIILKQECPLEEFPDDFPKVTKDQALAVLDIASKIVSSAKAKEWYEAFA